jgi:hypothetical protein
VRLGNDLAPVEAVSPTGKEGRRNPRFRVLLNAELVTTTDEQAVKVRDISTGGARLEAQRPIARGRDLILRRGTIELFAQTRWLSGNECGIEFDNALSEVEMLAFLHEPAKRPAFVPEPFKSSDSARTGLVVAADWAVVEAFRRPASPQWTKRATTSL